MLNRSAKAGTALGLLVALLCASAIHAPAQMPIFTLLFNFTYANGANPYAGLIQASDGKLYGVTAAGGANGSGTIFRFTTGGVFTLLHTFSATSSTGANGDGAFSMATLLQASDGNLYGMASRGGANGVGTIFTITTGGVFTNLWSMGAVSGAQPTDALVQAGAGLYGTAFYGDLGWGSVFALHVGLNTPFLSSLSPSSANAAGPALTLLLKGIMFSSTDTVHWTQGSTTTNLSTTFVSASELKAAVPASLIAVPGKATLTVVTAAGQTSQAKPFTIQLTTLKLVSATLTKTSTGAYTARITLKNAGHLSAPNVSITKSSLGAAATSATLPVSVGTLAAGASTSATLSFPSSAGSSGTVVSLKVAGTFTGGTFSGALKVTLP